MKLTCGAPRALAFMYRPAAICNFAVLQNCRLLLVGADGACRCRQLKHIAAQEVSQNAHNTHDEHKRPPFGTVNEEAGHALHERHGHKVGIHGDNGRGHGADYFKNGRVEHGQEPQPDKQQKEPEQVPGKLGIIRGEAPTLEKF